MNIRIYEDNGQWVLWLRDIDVKLFFDSETEARQAMAKIDTARAVLWRVQQLAETADNGPDVVQEYFDVGTFTDEDVAALGITAAQLTACVTMLQQFENFMSGEAITAAVYRSTLNQVRRVTT